MKIKSGFLMREVAGKHIVVAVGARVKDFNGVINLSPESALCWGMLEKGAEKEDIIKALTTEYDVEEKRASVDLDEFIKKLTEAGLVE